MEMHLKDTGVTRWGRPVMELEKPLIYKYDQVSAGIGFIRITVIVPSGFATDFASVPRVLWPIISPTGAWRSAAVVHDYLCSIHTPRPLTDSIFYTIMHEDDRIKRWQCCLIYGSVRAYWVAIGKWLP